MQDNHKPLRIHPIAVIVLGIMVAACGSTASVKTAENLSAPAGFPTEGQAGDTYTLPARKTNTWAATTGGKQAWQAHRGLGGSINLDEARRLFVVHNERNTPGCSNLAWFTLPALQGKQVERAELYLARVRKNGNLAPKLTVFDFNLLLKPEKDFFNRVTGYERITEPSIIVDTVFGEALEAVGMDERSTNPWANDVPLQSFSDYDVVDLTELVQASYQRGDNELVLKFGYTLGRDAQSVGGFDSDNQRCIIMWARDGAAKPRLKLTCRHEERK